MVMTQRRKKNTIPPVHKSVNNPANTIKTVGDSGRDANTTAKSGGSSRKADVGGSEFGVGSIKTGVGGKRIINVWWLPAVVTFVAVFLAQLHFPETLRLMEATDFYLNTPEFLSATLARYPGLNALLSAWLLQFFYYPVLGALIEALLAGLLALLVALVPRAWGKSAMAWISLLPAVSLCALFPHDITLHLEAVAFFSLFAIVGVAARTKGRVYWAIVSAAVVFSGCVSFFFLSFPATVLLMVGLAVTLMCTRKKDSPLAHRLVPSLLVLLMIGGVAIGVMASSKALGFIPLDERWWFVRDAGSKMWWYLLTYAMTMLLWAIPLPKVDAAKNNVAVANNKLATTKNNVAIANSNVAVANNTFARKRWDMWLTLFLSVVAGLFVYFHTIDNEKTVTSERMFRYSQMADRGEWRDLLNEILLSAQSAEAMTTGVVYNIPDQLDLELALLCEARLHTLPEHLFLYPINTPENFVPRFDDTPFSNNFCRIFYRELGLPDEAYHRAFQYGMGVQVNGGFCMASLRQMALSAAQQGDSLLTRKLTYLLSHTTLNHSYAESVGDTLRVALSRNRQLARSGAVRNVDGNVAMGVRDTLRADNFVGGYAFASEMVRLLEWQPNNRDFLDYLLCSLLLQKQLDKFYTIIRAFPLYAAENDGGAPLPRAYAEAAAMLEAMRPGSMRSFFDYDPVYDEKMREFQQLHRTGQDDSAFRGTFWYYYTYADTPTARAWNPQAASS